MSPFKESGDISGDYPMPFVPPKEGGTKPSLRSGTLPRSQAQSQESQPFITAGIAHQDRHITLFLFFHVIDLLPAATFAAASRLTDALRGIILCLLLFVIHLYIVY